MTEIATTDLFGRWGTSGLSDNTAIFPYSYSFNSFNNVNQIKFNSTSKSDKKLEKNVKDNNIDNKNIVYL